MKVHHQLSEHLSALYLNTIFLYHHACLSAGCEMQYLHCAASQPCAIDCSNILQVTQLCVLIGRKEQLSFLSYRTFFSHCLYLMTALRECHCVSSSLTVRSVKRIKIAAEFQGLILTFVSDEKRSELNVLGVFFLSVFC